MKIKKEYIIAFLVIAVSVLYLIFQRDSRINYEIPEFSALERENITSVAISRPGETLVLKKQGEMWTAGAAEYRADMPQINQLLAEAVKLSIVDLISSREDYDRYELNEDDALRIVISDSSGPVRDFYLGKSSDSNIYSYIRLPGNKGVYSVRGNLQSRFTLSMDKWRDKQVMNVNPDEITSIEITREGVTRTLAKTMVTETPRWTVDGAEAENSAEIQSNIESLSKLKCSEYLEDAVQGDPMVSVRITAGPAVHRAEIYEKVDSGYSARSSYAEDAFVIPAYLGDMLLKM